MSCAGVENVRERHAEQETLLAARTGSNEAMRWGVVERCNAIELLRVFFKVAAVEFDVWKEFGDWALVPDGNSRPRYHLLQLPLKLLVISCTLYLCYIQELMKFLNRLFQSTGFYCRGWLALIGWRCSPTLRLGWRED